MFFILLIILIIAFIICFILKKKNLLNIKLNAKKVLLILLVCIIIVVVYIIFINRHDIIFFFQSLEYESIDNYDYSNDIADNGHISKEGAIKIAKEKTNCERIAKVTCELIENGTYISYDEDLSNLSDNNYEVSNKQATYWMINLTTGWDYLCGHEESWFFKIDYYTGEILQWDVTD